MDERATVTLFVNGEQPKQILEELTEQANQLREELLRLEANGDTKGAQKIQRQLESLENQINVQELNRRVIGNMLKNLPRDNKDIVLQDDRAWRDRLKTLIPGSDEWVNAAKQAFITQELAQFFKDLEQQVGGSLSLGNNRPTTPADYRITEHQKNEQDYEQGLKTFTEYRQRMLEIEDEYNRLMSTSFLISQKERDKYQQAALRTRAALLNYENNQTEKEERQNRKQRILEIEEEYRQQQLSLLQRRETEQITERAYQEEKYRNEMDYLERLRQVYREDSYDRHEIERRIQRTEFSFKEKKAKEFIALKNQIERSYFMDYESMTREKYQEEYEYAKQVLAKIIEQRRNLLQLKKEEGIITSSQYDEEIAKLEKMYSIATKSLQKHFGQEVDLGEKFKRYWEGWTDEMGDRHEGLGEKITKWITPIASAITAVTQAMTESISTELEIRENKINRYYDRAIQVVQGNSYKEAKIEKKRQKDLEKAKIEAQKKQMGLQVLSAIATTAQNAVQAYGAGLQIGGIAGLIMAPIAAAAAIAAGAIQISTIKKQEELIKSQYSEGGYTEKGEKYKPVGIVHAGEWVAPKSMVENPVTGSIISNLEQIRQGRLSFNPGVLPQVKAISAQTHAIDSSPLIREYQIASTLRKELESIRSETLERTIIEKSTTDPELLSTINSLRQVLSEPIRAFIPMEGEGGLIDSSQLYVRLKNNVTPKHYQMEMPFARKHRK